jgi:hypothetical protein
MTLPDGCITRPIDPTRVVVDHARFFEKLTNARHRILVRCMMYHYVIEILGKVDEMMSTISPDAIYRFHGSQRAPNPIRYPQLRQVYEHVRVAASAGLVEAWAHDIAVSDNLVAVRGGSRQLISASSPDIPPRLQKQIDDREADYLLTEDLAWFYRFDTGDPPLILGAEVFIDEVGMSIAKVEDGKALIRGRVFEEAFAVALRSAGFPDRLAQSPAVRLFA